MYRFFLFRPQIKALKGNPTFWDDIDKGTLIKKLIFSYPQGEVRKGHIWVVSSDITSIDDATIHFKFGRISTKRKDAFDYEHSKFIDAEGEDVEYTDCIYLSDIQVLAVGKRAGIQAHPKTVAKYLCKLLKDCVNVEGLLTQEEQAVIKNSSCTAPQLRDPMPFLERMLAAYKISKYDVEISLPNPMDFKSKIHNPIQDLIQEVEGKKSVISVRNKEDGLNPNALEWVSRAAASLGDNAKAKIHQNEDDTTGTIVHMSRQAQDAYIDTDDVNFKENVSQFSTIIRDKIFSLFDRNYLEKVRINREDQGK